MSGLIYSLCALGLVMIGLYGLARAHHGLQQLLAINVMSAGVFMLLLTMAARHPPADAVPQALVLTGIVVAISALALGLALLRRLAAEEAESHD
ncbi:MAG: NADH-quinone oxidoreductase subunit K [Hydrogenovibrio sp.]|uniref:NADH-quinone oxidoreductase subunit K n=1 Tax=Hydrogenovibrio TaxID=28884 RepID=UPI00038076D5|nr:MULTISPECIES: NADH-quinone oxidoreductase subunit K [Hydrogenovibrio]MDR9499160.1 NADH-quinone oxidoreductase subunit K [Hydrogenovibrio sp.]